jgi:hypothetical protein
MGSVGAWYWIGVLAGVGAALGVFAAGIVPRWMLAAAAAALVGAVIGVVALRWDEGVAGAIGGLVGGFGATPIVAGSLRRGATRAGLAAIIGLAALGVAAVAFVPVAGYLEVLALPVLALRVRRKTPERYAGLRTLARD